MAAGLPGFLEAMAFENGDHLLGCQYRQRRHQLHRNGNGAGGHFGRQWHALTTLAHVSKTQQDGVTDILGRLLDTVALGNAAGNCRTHDRKATVLVCFEHDRVCVLLLRHVPSVPACPVPDLLRWLLHRRVQRSSEVAQVGVDAIAQVVAFGQELVMVSNLVFDDLA